MKEIRKLTRCPRGHFYDGSRFETCPHCANTQMPDVTVVGVDADAEITIADAGAAAASNPSGGRPQTAFSQGDPSVEQSSVTMQFYQKALGTEPVTGWLVCVRGVHYGQDFRIKSGRNFIGRGGNMDVCLSADRTVSRDRHAILTFDPLSRSFILQPGESSALCYLNRKPVLVPTELHTGDRIALGDTDLIFVPFCGESFSWDDAQKTNG